GHKSVPSVELIELSGIDKALDEGPSETLMVMTPSGSVRASFLAIDWKESTLYMRGGIENMTYNPVHPRTTGCRLLDLLNGDETTAARNVAFAILPPIPCVFSQIIIFLHFDSTLSCVKRMSVRCIKQPESPCGTIAIRYGAASDSRSIQFYARKEPKGVLNAVCFRKAGQYSEEFSSMAVDRDRHSWHS
ncbi:13885_t:CDS:2, partial [Acaulospora colombiana]